MGVDSDRELIEEVDHELLSSNESYGGCQTQQVRVEKWKNSEIA